MRKMNSIAGLLPVMLLLCLAGCGESKPDKDRNPGDPNKPVVPLTAPQQIEVAGFDGALKISFTKVDDAQGVTPAYDLWYGTNPNRTGSGNINLGKDVLKRDIMDDGTPKGPVSGRIEGLINGVEYNIWINADYGTLGASGYSQATGIPVPFPAIPMGVTATAGDGSIDVEWFDVDNASSYTVAYHTKSNVYDDAVVKITTTEPRYMITGLINDTTYYVWVSAYNNNGDSQYSAIKTATPAAATEPPDAPGMPVAARGTKSLKVTWGAVPGAAYYELYWGDSNDTLSITEPPIRVEIASGTVSAKIPDLENGKTYYIWVKAINAVDSSGFSPTGTGVPNRRTGINLGNINFVLGVPTAGYIFGEEMPPLSPLSRTGVADYQDSLHRSKETPIGNLFTDSALWYLNEYLDDPGKKVDFVFLNSGYIDAGIRPQDPAVTVGNLRSVVGNSADEIVILSMKGSDIKALFEYAAAYAPHMGFRGNHREGPGGDQFRSSGNWPIVSKEVNYTLQYPFVTREFMANNPPKIGSALAGSYFFGNIVPGTLKLNGANFDDNTIYRIATTDYNVDTRYTAPMIKAVTKDYTNIIYWHAVAEYIYDAEYITPAIDGRIRIKGGVIGGPFGVYEGYNQYCPADATYSEVYGCIFH